MPRETQLFTISLRQPLLRQMRREAKRRQTSVSALLRDAFLSYTATSPTLYSDEALEAMFALDILSKDDKIFLDKKLKKTA